MMHKNPLLVQKAWFLPQAKGRLTFCNVIDMHEGVHEPMLDKALEQALILADNLTCSMCSGLITASATQRAFPFGRPSQDRHSMTHELRKMFCAFEPDTLTSHCRYAACMCAKLLLLQYSLRSQLIVGAMFTCETTEESMAKLSQTHLYAMQGMPCA